MIYTNNHNLPEEIVKVLTPKGEWSITKGRYSVTALCGAPLPRILTMLYSDQIKEDVSSRLYSLLGQAVHHYVNERNDNQLMEYKMVQEIDGYTIAGVSDSYNNGVLIDWKVAGVFAYQKLKGGVNQDWANQLNVYKWMHEKEGRPVTQLKNFIIFRDWMVSKSFSEDYPNIPFAEIDVPFSTDIESYIRDRVKLHSEAEEMDIKDVPMCTAEERWEREGAWKVFHPDHSKGEKSMKNSTTEEEAIEYVKNQREIEVAKGKKGKDMDKAQIVYVPGASVRCESYCNVRDFCPYMKSI